MAVAREEFNPSEVGKEVKVLFVSEAPANLGKWGEYPYFYFKTQRPTMSSLYLNTMRAVFGDGLNYSSNKERYLKKFQELGYFLLDATSCPIDKLGLADAERDRIMETCANTNSLPQMRELDPVSILLIKKNVFEKLCPKLVSEGRVVLNGGPIPFPGSSHQADYRLLVRRYLNLPE